MRSTRNKEDDRKKTLIIFGGSFLLTAAFGLIAYFEWGKVKEVRAETETLRGQITAAEKKRREIPALERDVIVLRENVAEYVQILPDDREVNDFVNRINQFAAESGVVITSLEDVVRRDSRAKKKDPFERVVYKINLAGSTNEFMVFMSLFENHERFVSIPFFTIKSGRDDDGSEDVRHDIEMQIETFVYDAGGGAGFAKVEIPGYEEKRDKYASEIFEARKSVLVERYAFQPKLDRRDPFLDPRVVVADVEARELGRQKKILKELQDALAKVEGFLTAEASEKDLLQRSDLRQKGDDALAALATQIQTARVETWFPTSVIAQEFESTVERRVLQLVVERGIRASGRDMATLDQLLVERDEVRSLFEAGKYEEAIDRVEALIPRIDPVEKSEGFLAVLEEITRLRDHASAILEFQELRLEIQGVVFRPDGSAVIINGMVLAAGDPVSDEVVIGSIQEDEIEFRFRNFRISRLVQQ